MRTLFAPALMIAALFSPAAQSAPADLIFHHARIYTADDRLPRAEAIAIRGDRITAVGAPSDVLKLKGPSTRIVRSPPWDSSRTRTAVPRTGVKAQRDTLRCACEGTGLTMSYGGDWGHPDNQKMVVFSREADG